MCRGTCRAGLTKCKEQWMLSLANNRGFLEEWSRKDRWLRTILQVKRGTRGIGCKCRQRCKFGKATGKFGKKCLCCWWNLSSLECISSYSRRRHSTRLNHLNKRCKKSNSRNWCSWSHISRNESGLAKVQLGKFGGSFPATGKATLSRRYSTHDCS